MKKSNLLLNLLLAMTMVFGVVSCKEEPIIEEKEGLPVADGLYMAKVGEDPVAGAALKAANVDGSGISSLARPGFVQGYMYLTAGNYNLVEVSDKQIATTMGGALTTVSGADAHNTECGGESSTEYHVVAATVDGAAFAIPADGLYVVAYDGFSGGTSEIVFDEIESVGIIGDATPGGWGEDTPLVLTADINSDGFSASAEKVTLDVAQMKYRFNCRWAIDRRLDTGADFANDNGYSFWSNFGGTLSGTTVTLIPGNEAGNIQLSEYAEYTVTFAWDAIEGFSGTVTRTGDAVPKPDYPEAMYLTGSATTYGWAEPATDTDAIMHKIAGGTDGVFWKIAHLTAGEGFKLSAAAWGIPNIDCPNVDEFDAEGVAVTCSGNDWTVAEDGIYTIVLDLRNDMTKVSIKPTEVYGIGNAFGSWDSGVEANKFVVDIANKTVTSPALPAAGGIRTYVAHAWIQDWWNAEFVPLDGGIEYRNASSDDPTNVDGTAGQVITYMFDTNDSSVQ